MEIFSRQLQRSDAMTFRTRLGAALAVSALLASGEVQAQQVSAEDLMAYTPRQKDVEIDMPSKADLAQCKVEVKQAGKTSGYILTGPQGQMLRWFKDGEDADRAVDEFRYYKDGFEVYREIDSDNDSKIDQYRWMNTAGTRWGIDSNQDGVIDQWKILSAEELSREVVRALATRNEAALQAVLATAEDLKRLGFDADLTKEILGNVSAPGQKMQQILSQTKVIQPTTKWLRFDGQNPSLVPSDAGKATQDLTIYGNVMAIIETGSQTGFIQVGEILKVGDVWKLTQMPRAIDESVKELVAGSILRPGTGSSETVSADITPEMKLLIDQLTQLHENAPKPGDKPKRSAATMSSTPDSWGPWRRPAGPRATASSGSGSRSISLPRRRRSTPSRTASTS